MGKQLVAPARHVINVDNWLKRCALPGRTVGFLQVWRKQGKKGHEIHHKADLASANLYKHDNGKEIGRDALVPAADTTEWRKTSPTSRQTQRHRVKNHRKRLTAMGGGIQATLFQPRAAFRGTPSCNNTKKQADL